jgi:hypothetical protein
MSAHFHMDASEVDAYLAEITEEKRAKALRAATTAGARAAMPILRAATPRGATGNLQSAVRMKAMRKRYGIGSVVAPMGKKGRHRELVSGGTKAHIIAGRNGGFLNIGNRYMRAVNHPGAKANPFLARVAGSMTEAAVRAFETRMERYIESGRQPSE